MGDYFLLQGIFPTQGSNLGLLNCRQMPYHLSYQGSLNNAIAEIKSTLEGTNSRITEVEDRISEVEDRIVEINEAERKKEKKNEKK